MSTIPGTRASAPIAPGDRRASAFPIDAADDDRDAARPGSESAGTSAAPATMTSSETPRFPQSRPGVERPEDAKPLGDGLDAPAALDPLGLRHRRLRLPSWENCAVIPRYFVVAEREHEIQNPTSEEKLLLLGERLGSGRDRVCSTSPRAAAARRSLLAREYGCTMAGSRSRPSSTRWRSSEPRRRGLAERVVVRARRRREADLRAARRTTSRMCLGASFVWGGLAGTARRARAGVRPGGHVVVGEPFWRTLPAARRLRGP